MWCWPAARSIASMACSFGCAPRERPPSRAPAILRILYGRPRGSRGDICQILCCPRGQAFDDVDFGGHAFLVRRRRWACTSPVTPRPGAAAEQLHASATSISSSWPSGKASRDWSMRCPETPATSLPGLKPTAGARRPRTSPIRSRLSKNCLKQLSDAAADSGNYSVPGRRNENEVRGVPGLRLLLFLHPGHVPGNSRMPEQCLFAAKVVGQLLLRDEVMNAVVALSADVDAAAERIFRFVSRF